MSDPTHAALLAALVADPADRLSRLALADWYEEQGTRAASREAARIRRAVGAKRWQWSFPCMWGDPVVNRLGHEFGSLHRHEFFTRYAGVIVRANCQIVTWKRYASALVAEYPISGLYLFPDRRHLEAIAEYAPFELKGPLKGFVWLEETRQGDDHARLVRSLLPPWLFSLLAGANDCGFLPGVEGVPRYALYSSYASALKALTDAALLWAHSAPA